MTGQFQVVLATSQNGITMVLSQCLIDFLIHIDLMQLIDDPFFCTTHSLCKELGYLTLIFAYDDFAQNTTVNGKKSFGIERGALNSSEPDLLLESIRGRLHVN